MLVKCPECGRKISTTATACPKCGCSPSPEQMQRLEKSAEWSKSLILIAVWIAFGVAWFDDHSWIPGLIFWTPLAIVAGVVAVALLAPVFKRPAPLTEAVKRPSPRASANRPAARTDPPEAGPNAGPPTLGGTLEKIKAGDPLAIAEAGLVAPIVDASRSFRPRLSSVQFAFVRNVERDIEHKRASGAPIADIELEFEEARAARRRKHQLAGLSVVAVIAFIGLLTWGDPERAGTTVDSGSTSPLYVRGERLYVGQLADDVFEILDQSDVVTQEVIPDPSDPSSQQVTKNYSANGQTFAVVFRRTERDGPYRVTAIKRDEVETMVGTQDAADVPHTVSRPSPSVASDAVDCYALAKYAEAQGHGWLEKSAIVGDAEKSGRCTWNRE